MAKIHPRKMTVEALRAHQEEWNPMLHVDMDGEALTAMLLLCEEMYNMPIEEYRQYLIEQLEVNGG